MKLTNDPIGPDLMVASFMGAWVETKSSQIHHFRPFVASFIGAWVETSWAGKLGMLTIVASFMDA